MPEALNADRERMRKQLDELHRRIAELERMRPHSSEHEISWDTVVGECRKKHEETMRRLGTVTDPSSMRAVKDDVEALHDRVSEHESLLP